MLKQATSAEVPGVRPAQLVSDASVRVRTAAAGAASAADLDKAKMIMDRARSHDGMLKTLPPRPQSAPMSAPREPTYTCTSADDMPLPTTPPHDSAASGKKCRHTLPQYQHKTTTPDIEKQSSTAATAVIASEAVAATAAPSYSTPYSSSSTRLSPFEYHNMPLLVQTVNKSSVRASSSSSSGTPPGSPWRPMHTASATSASQGRHDVLLAGPAAVMTAQRSASAPPAPGAAHRRQPISPPRPPAFVGSAQLLHPDGGTISLLKPTCRRGALSAPPQPPAPSASASAAGHQTSPTANTSITTTSITTTSITTTNASASASTSTSTSSTTIVSPSLSTSTSPSPSTSTSSVEPAMLNVNGKKRGAELLVGDDSLVCYGLRCNVLPVEAMLDYACNIAEGWQHVESIDARDASDCHEDGCGDGLSNSGGSGAEGAVESDDGGGGNNGNNNVSSIIMTLVTPVKASVILPPSPPTSAPPPTPVALDCRSGSKGGREGSLSITTNSLSSLIIREEDIQDALIREVDRPARVCKMLQDINALGLGWGTVQWSAVKHLDFSAGKLRSLAGIDIFANLETIIVDNNLLDSLDSSGTIPSVKTLSLNFNAVYGLDAVLSCIRDKFPKLTFLSLLGNPCCASELYGSTANQYEAYCNKVAEVLTELKFLDSSPITRKAPKQRPIKSNLLTAAKSLRSGDLLSFADAMTKTVVLSGKHAGNQSKQLTMKMLKEVTIAARQAVSTSTNTLVAMGDNVSTRLLGLEPTVVQALVQPPDLESIPMAGNDMMSWATRKRELGIISLEEYKHFVKTANVMNVEARELAMSNHYLAIDRLEALIHPEEAEGDRPVISVGDDGFSKKMTEGGGLDGVGGKKYTHHDLPPMLDFAADGMLDELATSVEGLSQFSNLSYV